MEKVTKTIISLCLCIEQKVFRRVAPIEFVNGTPLVPVDFLMMQVLDGLKVEATQIVASLHYPQQGANVIGPLLSILLQVLSQLA